MWAPAGGLRTFRIGQPQELPLHITAIEESQLALFISFEGGEGSGKTTQVERLVRKLSSLNIPHTQLHEPGSTNLGVRVREIIKGRPLYNETIAPTAELFLFAAARAQLVNKILEHETKRDSLVIVADRYADSTIAYQAYGRRLSLELVEATNRLATDGIMPDITFLIDVPPKAGLERTGALQAQLFDFNAKELGRIDDESSRRFEEEPLAFHERVRRGYRDLVRAEPERWQVVDGLMSQDDVFDAIWETVQSLDKFRAMRAESESVSDMSLETQFAV